MASPEKVKIVEVGPRDGLQNEPENVSTEAKLNLIERLAEAGLSAIEATAFVSPRRVPQMGDHAEIMTRLRRRPGVSYSVLVPNLQGFEAAASAGAREIALFTSASEAFCRKNIHCSIEESFERFRPVAEAARQASIEVRGYVSCALGCPYGEVVAAGKPAEVAQRLWEIGCHEISLADTIGVGTAGGTKRVFEAAIKLVPVQRLAGHFHDTYGQALANIYASLEMGVRVFDASVAGLGGCPFAAGATGNVATEDVVYLMNGLGIETGVDLGKVIDAGKFICEVLGKPTHSRVARAVLAKRG